MLSFPLSPERGAKLLLAAYRSVQTLSDRYDVFGKPPSPICTGYCEGTGWVPVYVRPQVVPEGHAIASSETDLTLLKLWEETERVSPSDDGYHFVRCPDCGGSGQRVLGGKGSGNFGHQGRKGERGGSGEGSDTPKVRNERSLRALKAFVPVTKEGQQKAEKVEQHIAKLAGGKVVEGTLDPRTGKLHRNAPVDVVTSHGGKTQGIEVKTLLNQKNDKLTVRKNAGELKTFWGRSNHASVHIVAVDKREGSKGEIYYRRGHGSFRLGAMTPVKNASHLRALLGAR